MALLETPPPSLAEYLASRGISLNELLLCTESDLNMAGDKASVWLAITQSKVLTISISNECASISGELPIEHLKSARIDVRVGTGFLEVEVEGHFMELLRFSNSLAGKFSKAASKLESLIKGRGLIITPEDDKEDDICPTCGLVLWATGGVCPRCIRKGAVFLRFLQLMRPYWAKGCLALGLLFFGIGLDLVPPRLTKILVDNVFGTNPPPGWFKAISTTFSADSKAGWLLILVSALAGTQLVRIGINIINGRLATIIGTQIAFDLRKKLFAKLQELSIAFYDRNQVGQLMTRVTQDTEELQSFVWQVTSGFVVNIFLLVGIGVVLFSMNPRLAAYTLIPAPFVLASTYLYWYFVAPRSRKYWDRRSRLSGAISTSLSGIRVVKAFAQENREGNRFDTYSNNLRVARMGIDKAASTFNPIVGFIFGLGGLIIWFVGGHNVLSNEISLGTLMAFFGYLGMFYGPLSQLTSMSQWVTSFATAAHRLFEILDTEPEMAGTSSSRNVAITGEIEFKNVTFGYNKHHPVLKDINVRVEPGEMIGIVGPSGSGKSTFINLLCRFYDPDFGSVSIDGVDLREIEKNSLRGQIGLVLQEPYLFRGTITENIAYGRPEASMEEVMNAAKAANAHDFIATLPDGYDTKLGDGGAGLSGGERQRVSIARALLYDPRILILDEATSSVDTESEKAIQEALSVITKGRTTFAIAHRLSTLRNSDRILVIEDGRVKEMGTHEELMALGGLYYRLVRIQLQLSKDEETVDKLNTLGKPA